MTELVIWYFGIGMVVSGVALAWALKDGNREAVWSAVLLVAILWPVVVVGFFATALFGFRRR